MTEAAHQFRTNPLLAIPQAKRVNPQVLFEYIRDLELADVAKLGQDVGTVTPMIQRIKHRHHSLARGLADGLSPSEAAAVTGYSLSRTSILQNDPAFQELVEFYRSQVRERFLNAVQKRAELHESVVDELQARVDENPEGFTKSELNELLKSTKEPGPVFGVATGAPVGLAVSISFKDPPPREIIDVTPER